MLEVVYNRGLYLPAADLWLDPRDAQPHAFVSHAHADHFARHQLTLCSTATAALLRARYQTPAERLAPLDFHQPLEHNGHLLQLLPAGHIFGSAMLHVTSRETGKTLLYTGDFKLRRGRTAEPAVLKAADTLVLETTFGLPQFVFPSALETEGAVLRFVHEAFDDGDTPVLLGYSLGKAQEALALLAEHGIPALLHPSVAAMTAACRAAGCELPEPRELTGPVPPGHVVIAPPNAVRSKLIRSLRNARSAMLTGWALTPGAKFRYRTDEAIPLSDHADHPALLETIQRVRPKHILTLHGYAREFAAELRALGMDAWSVFGNDQLEIAFGGPRRAGTRSPLHARPGCGLASFSDVCQNVASTNSRIEKINHLAWYLKGLEPEQLRLAATWLTGQAFPRSHRLRAVHTGSATLRRALLSLPGATEPRYRTISASQNDPARTARLVMEELMLKPAAAELGEIDGFFHQLAEARGPLARIDLLAARLATLHPREGETLVRLLTGDLRIGLKEGLLEEALASAFEVPAEEVREAHMLTGDLGTTAVLAKENALGAASLTPGVPLKCMLASPEVDAAAIYQRLTAERPGPVWLEPKFDGIRAQLHKHGDQVGLFSRDLRSLGAEFPELLEAARRMPSDVVLDGEIIAHADDRRLTFGDLQTRLGRDNRQPDLFAGGSAAARVPVRFIAFDLLWCNGVDMLGEPLHERRERLERLGMPEPLELIEVFSAASVAEVEEVFGEALRRGHEGVIGKDPESFYTPARRGRAWLKFKGVAASLDCVVVAAEQGHGRRSELLSDYTFAVRDAESGALLTIGKAYSGLTEAEIEELTEHFRRTTLRSVGRRHEVEPTVVLEIAFDRVQESSRHGSGLALRFPRIKGIRRDKGVAEIDTLQAARALVG